MILLLFEVYLVLLFYDNILIAYNSLFIIFILLIVKFLELVRPFCAVLPEVAKPDKKVLRIYSFSIILLCIKLLFSIGISLFRSSFEKRCRGLSLHFLFTSFAHRFATKN